MERSAGLTDEQKELVRVAAARVIADHDAGRVVDPYTLRWARHIVEHVRPLGRPVGTGEPAEVF
jgi:hypothetical protein